MENISTGQRPTFLTVLCILSFAGGLWGAWDGIKNAFTNAPLEEVEEARTAIEEAMTQVDGAGADLAVRMMEEGLAIAEQAAANAVPLGYIGLLSSILGLVGVWMMWNLRKNGFYIYVLSSVLGLFLPYIFLGFSMVGLMGLGFIGFITVLFIVLYAIHLKYMN
jgi:hypothetical protein